MNITVTKKPHAEAEISGVLTVADVDKEFGKAIERAVREVELPGFRKGKAPKERVLQEIGEKSIWRDAAEEALKEVLGDIFKEHKIFPILPPSIALTVSAPQTEVPFVVTIVTQPKAEIQDYKKTTEAALKKLEPLDRVKEKADAKKALDLQVDAMLGRTPESPALTDDDAKRIGLENVAALTHFIDTEADRAVDQHDDQRRRSAVAEALLATATIDVPLVIVEDEARGMLESTKQNIASQGMPFNEYLEKRGVTEEQIVQEMLPVAEKRVSLDLIFAKIAHEEKITPVDEDVHRVAHALMRQGTPDDRAHSYAAEMSVREGIWKFLGVVTTLPPAPVVEEKREA